MKNSWPFLGMVLAIAAQASDAVVSKAAMSQGFSEYILVLYSNALSTLLLFPLSFFHHRSDLPPLSFSIVSSFFLFALLGCSGLLFGYAGIQYSSPTLSTAMLNLVPAFTFVLTLFLRMEKLNLRVPSSQAKLAGTIVSIIGAFTVTFYKGGAIISGSSANELIHQVLSSPSKDWIIGGFFSLAHALVAALWYTYQATILKEYPAILIVLTFYCFFVTIQCTVVSLILERDLNAWKLRLDTSLVAVVYSAVVGTVFRYIMTMLCVKATGPLYVAMFKPVGIVVAAIMSILFLGDNLYLGSVIGAIVIAAGFYTFMWGKAREEKAGEESEVESLESPPEALSKEPLLPPLLPSKKHESIWKDSNV